MLNHLSIKNFILIEDIEIDFFKGFSVITGETGAGKSIILNAINFLLGNRVDTNIVAVNKDKCIVEGIFTSDTKDEIIIRREMNTNGRSRCFYNDEPTQLTPYKELTKNLIDIHSQHQSLLLNDNEFQQKILDRVAQHQPLLDTFKTEFSAWKKMNNELNNLEVLASQAQKDSDYISFQLEQLDKVHLQENEYEQLEQKAYKLRNSEEIKTTISKILQILGQDNVGVLSLLNKCDVHNYFPAINTRLDSIKIEIKDIVQELDKHYEECEIDPSDLIEVEDRLNTINSLFHKHNVKNVSELIQIREEYRQKLAEIGSYDEKINDLKRKILEKHDQLAVLAEKLSFNRKKQCTHVKEFLIDNLKALGIPRAKVEIKITDLPNYTSSGKDDVRLFFSANIDQPLKEVSEVASGGEKSRLMLCIKSLIADVDNVPTIIFDEIDTGVSGQVAMKIAHIMNNIAENRQVISITHLPQVASQATNHYKVFKKETNNETHTYIKLLQHDEQIKEIASMLSGDDPQPVVIANAEFLMKNKK